MTILNDLPTPKSLSELDQLCDRWRQSMSVVFDFDIGAKKQNKLRDAVCRFLGYPNGYQQLKSTFPQGKNDVLCPEDWPDVLVLEDCMGDMSIFFGLGDMTPLKNDQILEVEKMNERDDEKVLMYDHLDYQAVVIDQGNCSPNVVDGMTFDEIREVIEAHYYCTRVFVRIPRFDRYGVPPIATEDQAPKIIQEELGIDTPDLMDEHFLSDTGDDSAMTVFLKLVRK